MKKQESFWNYKIKSFPLLAVILIAFSVIVILILYGLNYKFNENFFCSLEENKDECVCEEPSCIQYYDDGTCFISISSGEDLNCRKLSQQELLEKSCKEKPREDEDCKCVEYEKEDLKLSTDSRDFLKLSTDSRDFQNNKNYLNENCIQVNKEGHDPDKSLDITISKLTKVGIEYSLIKSTDASIFLCESKIEKCTSSIPKTPCEKGDEDWVEEVIGQYYFQGEFVSNATECRPKTIYDIPCQELKKEIILWTGRYKHTKILGEKYTIEDVYDIAIEKECEI